MADFNIGILSTLDIDSNSSRKKINDTIKKIQENIDSVRAELEVAPTKTSQNKVVKSANRVISDINKNGNLRKINIELGVNKTQSTKNINKALSEINKQFKGKTVDITVNAKADAKSIQNAGKKVQSTTAGVPNVNAPSLNEALKQTTDIEKAQVRLNNVYSDTATLRKSLDAQISQGMSYQIDKILNTDKTLRAYSVTLSRVNELGKNLSSTRFEYKPTANGIELHTLKEADRLNKAAVITQQQVNKEVNKEIAAVQTLNDKGKISLEQARQLKKEYNALRILDSKSTVDVSTYEKQKQAVIATKNEIVNQNKLLKQQQDMMSQIEGLERRKADAIDKRATRDLKAQVMGLNDNPAKTFGKDAAYNMTQIQSQVKAISAEADRATRSQLTFVDSFKQAMVKFPIWMGASTLFFGAIQSGKLFVNTITEIDSKMTTLAKVMPESTDMEAIFVKANDAALQFGQTISGVLDAYAEFARQGESGAELTQFGNAALIASNVGEIGAQQAAEYLTAMSAQWETGGNEAMKQVDALNEVSNNYATTVEKLAQGQAKAASTAKAMGLNFDQTNGIIGMLTAKTKQSGDEIGNFMKAVLPKLYNGVGKQTLEGLGINLKDGNGDLKSAITLLEEASQKVKNLDKDQQAAVVRGLGGVYHYQRMQVLLDDLGSVDSMYKQIAESSENSGGSALAENAKYMQSMEAKINAAKVSVEQFAVALGDVFLKAGILDGIRLFTNLMTGLTQSLSDAGSAAPLIGGLIGTLSLFSGEVRSGFGSARQSIADYLLVQNKLTAVRNADGLVTGFQNASGAMFRLNEAQKQVTTSALVSSGAVKTHGASVAASTAATNVATGATIAFKSALRGLAAATGVGLVVTGISFALEKVVGSFDKASQASEQFNQSQQQLKTGIEAQGSDNVTKTIEQYEKLQNQINNNTISSEGLEKYKNVTNELANLFPDLVNGEGQFGSNVANNAGIMQNRVDIMKQQLEVQKLLNAEKAKEAEEDAIKAAKDANSGLAGKLNSERNKLHALQGKYTSGDSGRQNELAKISEQINKVKDLTSATQAQKLAEEAYTKARAENYSGADLQAYKDRVEAARNMVSLTGQAANANALAMAQSQMQFQSAIANITAANSKLGQTSDAVFQRISGAIMGSTTSADRAKNAMVQFENALRSDSGFKTKMENYTQAIEKFKKAAANGGNTEQAVKDVQKAYSALNSEINRIATSGDAKKVFNNTKDVNVLKNSLKQLNNTYLGVGDSASEAANGVNEHSEAVQQATANTEEAINAQEEFADSMRNIANNNELVNKALEEMRDGQLTWATMSDLAEQYGDAVLGLAGNEEALTDYIIAQRDRDNEHYRQSVQAKLGASAEYYQAVAGQGTELYNHMKDVYGIDMNNYSTMNEFKADIGDKWANGTNKQQSDLINALAKVYGIDVSNFGTLAEKKQAVENKLMTYLGQKWQDYINYIATTTNNVFAAISEEGRQAQEAMDAAAALAGVSTPGVAGLGLDIGSKQIGLADSFSSFMASESFQQDAVFRNATAAMNDVGKVAGTLGDGLQNLSDVGKSAGDGIGKAGDGGKKASKGLKDASKAAKETADKAKEANVEVEKLYKTFQVQTYVADKLAMSLEKINYQLEKQKMNTQQYATWSTSYRESLRKENKLIEQKTKNINSQIKALDKQIKSGKINEYGLVSSDVNAAYNKYTANGISGAETGKVISKASGSSTQAKVWNFLKSKGFTDAQAAGIMGNIEIESRFNPAAEQIKGNKWAGGKGLFQWDDRKGNLYNYAASKGKSWTDLQTQLDFFWKELQTTESNAYRYVKGARSTVQASELFQQKFERAGIPHQAKRNAAAQKYYNQFNGYRASSSSSSVTGAIVSGTSGSSIVSDSWVRDKQFGRYNEGGTHFGRDLNANNMSGKPIKAARAGVVAFNGWTGGGNTVSIWDGVNTYTYMHMLAPSPLKKGSAVKAGQVVGKVGNTFDRRLGGNSTGTHLHVQVNKGKTPTGTFMDTFSGANRAIDPVANGYLKVSGRGKISGSYSTGAAATGSISANYANDLNAAEEARLAQIEQYIQQHNNEQAMKQKVDEAKKKLLDLRLESLKNSNASKENKFLISKSYVDWYEHKRELQSITTANLQYEADKIAFRKGTSNEQWRKANDKVAFSKQREVDWEKQKQKFISGALKNTKLFSKDSAYRAEFADLLRSSKQAVNENLMEISRLSEASLTSLLDRIDEDYANSIGSIQSKLEGLSRTREKLDLDSDKDSKKNVDTIKAQAVEQMKYANQIKFTLTQLESQQKYVKNIDSLNKRVKDRIKELKTAYEDAALAAHKFKVEAADADIERRLNINARRLKSYQKGLQKADYANAFISQEYQVDLWRKNQVDKLKALRYERKGLEENRAALEKQYEMYKNMPAQAKRIKEALEEITTQTEANKSNIHQIRYDLSNSIVNSLKTIYQKQLELANKAYDDEYKAYEKLINKKLKLIDEEASEDQFNKDVEEKLKAITKTKDEIAQRTGDDSLSNQKKIKDLQEQLKQQEEEYKNYLENKNREDRKKALQEELEDKGTQIEKQKEDLGKAYNDLLEDTRRFNEIQEQLMEGQVDKYKQLIADLNKFVNDNMKDIGTSVSTNILDQLNQTFGSLESLTKQLQADELKNNPVPNSNLKPTAKPTISENAIKAVNAISPASLLNAFNIAKPVLPTDITQPSNITTNNVTAPALVTIQNFNGTKQEADNLVDTLANKMRVQGIL